MNATSAAKVLRLAASRAAAAGDGHHRRCGLAGAAGSFLAGALGYGLCRAFGRGAARRLLGPDVACMAGLTRMPARTFFSALACGSLPLGFAFAAIGQTGTDHSLAVVPPSA